MTTPHDTFRDQLLDLAYGELGRREARALHAHLETCDACRAELAQMNGTRSAMAGLGPEPAPERGEDVLLAAAREAARARVRKPAPILPSWVWGASLGAVGAAAVLLLSLEVAPRLRAPTAEPDATELVSSAPPAAPAAAPPAAEPPSAPAGVEGGGAAQDTLAREEKVAPAPPKKRAFAAGPRDEANGAGAKERAPRREPDELDGALSLREDEAVASKPSPAEQPPPAAGAAPSPRSKRSAGPSAAPRVAAAPPPAPAAAKQEAPSAAPPSAAGEASADAAPADRLARAKGLPAVKGLTQREGAEDPIARHARLAVAGGLQAATRAFPGCPAEASRVVESDAAGRVVKVTRRGAASGKPFVLEQFYAEGGALAAVRWSSEGRVHELRLGPDGATGAVAAVPAFALEPRAAAAAGPGAPPRCSP